MTHARAIASSPGLTAVVQLTTSVTTSAASEIDARSKARSSRARGSLRQQQQVAQRTAQHFAHGVPRQSLSEEHRGWALIVNQMQSAVCLQPALVEGRVSAHDHRNNALAAPVVRQAKHSGFLHTRALV